MRGGRSIFRAAGFLRVNGTEHAEFEMAQLVVLAAAFERARIRLSVEARPDRASPVAWESNSMFAQPVRLFPGTNHQFMGSSIKEREAYRTRPLLRARNEDFVGTGNCKTEDVDFVPHTVQVTFAEWFGRC